MKSISRVELIKQLVRKHYGKKRPTGEEIMTVIKEYDLQLHKSDGRKRSRSAVTKSIAKAYKVLS